MKFWLDEGAYMPIKAHKTDAGYDVKSPVYGYIPAKGTLNVYTGIHCEIPEGYTGLILPKSGLNINHSIMAFGVIDTGYTGQIVVKLYNFSDESYTFERGDKITQLVITKIMAEDNDNYEFASERGDNGFGSTGK